MIVAKLKGEIAALELQVLEIQGACSHPTLAVRSVNKSDTGNYDPGADHYWREHHCLLCDKKWCEELGRGR